MFSKLKDVKKKYKKIAKEINDPEVIANRDKWQELIKEYNDLKPLVEMYDEYNEVKESIEEYKEMLKGKLEKEMQEMVKEELNEAQRKIPKIEIELKELMIPKDPNDEKNVIIEIRGGAGGDEASLFSADLFRMYTKYADILGYETEILSTSINETGGYKEISFIIRGEGAYSKFKFESGVHRVQRIPETESGGRIHTSTVTVAVLPEAEEIDFKLNMNEVRVDVYRSSGNGGQSVNTTDSAVRLTHEPTGVIVTCQDGKSQHKNKDKAFKVLRSRLYEREVRKREEELSSERKNQVGTGDRSERIRTYNYPQSRVTDHRINLTLHKLQNILDGELEEVVSALIAEDRAKKLKN